MLGLNRISPKNSFACTDSSRWIAPISSFIFFFSSRRRHTRFDCDWSSDVCSSDLPVPFTPMDPSGQPLITPMVPSSSGPAQPAPGSVSTDPLYNLPPSMQHIMGISTAPIPMVDARTNRYGLSYDGGRSVVDATSGQLEQVAGRGWQTAGPEGAVGESR